VRRFLNNPIGPNVSPSTEAAPPAPNTAETAPSYRRCAERYWLQVHMPREKHDEPSRAGRPPMPVPRPHATGSPSDADRPHHPGTGHASADHAPAGRFAGGLLPSVDDSCAGHPANGDSTPAVRPARQRDNAPPVAATDPSPPPPIDLHGSRRYAPAHHGAP